MFRTDYERRLLSHNVHKFACDVNDFANRQSSDKALNIGIGKRRFLDGLTVGIGIDENLTAQLAVYLDDNLDFISDKRVFINGRPRGIQ